MMQLIPMIFRTKPCIPETDFSGAIVRTGSKVPFSRELFPGTAVFGSVPIGEHVSSGKGALAEYVVVPAESVCLKPDNVSFEQAAGLPIAGITALSVLDLAKLKEGYKVLVNGASGGIGCMALQMAKDVVGNSGKVVAVCSGRNLEMVKGLGADEVIDYHDHAPVHKYLAQRFGSEPFDVILDCRGIQEVFLHCEGYLKPGMPFVTVGPAPPDYSVVGMLHAIGQMLSNALWPRWLGGVNRPYFTAARFANLPDMERLARLAREGKLRVPIDPCWDFGDVLKAYDVMLSKRARGKIVVKV